MGTNSKWGGGWVVVGQMTGNRESDPQGDWHDRLSLTRE